MKTLSITLALTLLGCGGQSTGAPPEYPPMRAPVVSSPEPLAQVEPVVVAPPAPVMATVEHTPIEGTSPTLAIAAPKEGKLIRRGPVMLKLTLSNWDLSPQGNHVHVIVDNLPYIAVRDVSAPIDLGKLMADNLQQELTPGTHVVRVFPSRGHHESVKTAGAFASVMFHYQQKSDTFGAINPTRGPLLTYSRPKGCNAVGSPLLVDFYVSNTTLASDGNRVRWTLDGAQTGSIDSWTPHHLTNLSVGTHTLALALVDAQGDAVQGIFNNTTRDFEIAETCTPAATPAAAVEHAH